MSYISKFMPYSLDNFEFNGTKLGSTFTIFPFFEIFKERGLSTLTDELLAVLISIGVHCDRNGIAILSLDRIRILSGIGLPKVKHAISQLIEVKLLIQLPQQNYYKLLIKKKIYKNMDISVFYSFVIRGIWAALTPASKRLYLILLSLSEPFNIDYDKFYDGVEYKKLVLMPSQKNSGRRMVKSDKTRFDLLECEMNRTDRTRRNSTTQLLELGIIEHGEGGILFILHNVPSIINPQLIKALQDSSNRSTISPGVARSIAWHTRRRKAANNP